MKKDISLPGCNLYMTGTGHDANGNKIIKIKFPNERGFSIQTGGGALKKTSSILRGRKSMTDLLEISNSELKDISKEVSSYIKKYGSDNQKKRIRIY